MKVYKSFEELKDADPYIQSYFVQLEHAKSFEELCNEISNEEEFEGYYGGMICVIENDIDLKEIATDIEDPTANRWKSIDEVAYNFDECKIHHNYVVVYNTTNNSGGNTYFIPIKYLYEYPTIRKSIALSLDSF